MKIFYSDLPSHQVEKLVIHSLEQALYQAIVVIDGEEWAVWEGEQKTLVTRSLVHMRERFEHLEIPAIVLRQESAYDEMVGQARREARNRMEVPLGRTTFPEA
ncbi:DUF6482 family protein [Haliea sp. E17]|uniref:DUF6482 family protein n=1 Tax=Haliea sp. E17 TaxID=3401576 RepID=UPI003AABCE00